MESFLKGFAKTSTESKLLRFPLNLLKIKINDNWQIFPKLEINFFLEPYIDGQLKYVLFDTGNESGYIHLSFKHLKEFSIQSNYFDFLMKGRSKAISNDEFLFKFDDRIIFKSKLGFTKAPLLWYDRINIGIHSIIQFVSLIKSDQNSNGIEFYLK